MNEVKIIRTPCLAIFKDKKLLCVKTKGRDVYFFIGGKVENSESDEYCLTREVKEEINCSLDKSSITKIVEFADQAYGRENTIVEVALYSAKVIGEPTPSNEVTALEFIDSTVNQELLTEIANNKVFPYLKEKRLIN